MLIRKQKFDPFRDWRLVLRLGMLRLGVLRLGVLRLRVLRLGVLRLRVLRLEISATLDSCLSNL